MNCKKTLVTAILTCFTFVVNAQVWELGLQAGGAGYIGDLNPTNPLKVSGHAVGGFLRANFDPYWALSFNYTNGKIKADDAKSGYSQFRDRNLSFSTKLHEFSFLVDFNFFDYFSGGGFKRFSPYLYAGLGAVLFNPKTTYLGNEYALALYKTEGQAEPYNRYAFSVPFGAGVKYNFSENWGVLANIGYRNAYTDYLDDVSGLYPDPAVFNSGDIDYRLEQMILSNRSSTLNGSLKNTQRGDFRKRDTYMFVGIGITYTFVSQKCF